MRTITNEQIVEAIGSKTILEVTQLVKAIEKRFDVKAMAPTAVVPEAPKEVVEEQTEFNVVLEGFTDKIKVIKLVREVTGLGLKESKDVVEKTPSVLREAISKKEAEELVKRVEALGGKAKIQ